MVTETGEYSEGAEVQRREALHRSCSAPSLSVKHAAVLRILGVRKPPLPVELQASGKAASPFADSWSKVSSPNTYTNPNTRAARERLQNVTGDSERDMTYQDPVSTGTTASRCVRICRSSGRLAAVVWESPLVADTDDMDCSPNGCEDMMGVECPVLHVAGTGISSQLPELAAQLGPNQSELFQLPHGEEMLSYSSAVVEYGCGVELSGDALAWQAAAAAATSCGGLTRGAASLGSAVGKSILRVPISTPQPSVSSMVAFPLAVESAPGRAAGSVAPESPKSTQPPQSPAAPACRPAESRHEGPVRHPPLTQASPSPPPGVAMATGLRGTGGPAPNGGQQPAAAGGVRQRKLYPSPTGLQRRQSSSDSDRDSDSDVDDRWARAARRLAKASASASTSTAPLGRGEGRSPPRDTAVHRLVVESPSSISLTLGPGPGATCGMARSASGSPTRMRQPRQRSLRLSRKRLLV